MPNGPGDGERRLAAATLAGVFYIFEDGPKLRTRALRTLVTILNTNNTVLGTRRSGANR